MRNDYEHGRRAHRSHGRPPFDGPHQAPHGGPGGHGGHGPRSHGGRGRGFGRPGGWQQADLPAADDAADWFAGRLPDGWFTGRPSVVVDREEITVIGELAADDVKDGGQASDAAASGRIGRFRQETRDERIAVAAEAERRYGRKVAWGARVGEYSELFTHLAVPVMTRLRQPERRVLDTLVDSGVARSRSDALSWCVTLVGEHTDEWLTNLREAMSEVDKLRSEGPEL